MTKFGERLLLAEGRLDWPRSERQTDRYGVVNIQTAGRHPEEYEREQIEELIARAGTSMDQGSITRLEDDPSTEYATFTEAPVGTMGRLLVRVLVIRKSYHVGDSSREIKPVTPEVGEIIVLGEGELFVESANHNDTSLIGVRPEDGREMDWMDPHALYRAHDQTVELSYEPKISSKEQVEKSKLTPIQFNLVAQTHLSGTVLLEALSRIHLSTDSDGNIDNLVIENLRKMLQSATSMTEDEIVKAKCQSMLEFLDDF